MVIPDSFLEYYFGKYRQVDLHNLTKEDARAELVYAIETTDFDVATLIVIHGYHGGTVIKNLIRKEFKSQDVLEKINLDAGRTIYLLKK